MNFPETMKAVKLAHQSEFGCSTVNEYLSHQLLASPQTLFGIRHVFLPHDSLRESAGEANELASDSVSVTRSERSEAEL